MSAGNGQNLLEVEDLHVYLGESHILQGVSFSVREGGVTALLGRNGVGKTTTLQGILGLVERKGRVSFGGEEVGGMSTHRLVRLGVGYVPEEREVFSRLTVRENLRLAERGDGSHHYDRVYELFPELKQRGSQKAGTLSGGQQQMLAVARALLNDNRILLVDEPTKGLAPRVVSEVVEALERAGEVATILLVEQNLKVARRLARDVTVIDQGQVAYTGTVEELLDDPELTRRHLGVAGADGGGQH